MALWLACGAAVVRGVYDKFRNHFGFCYCALFERGVHLSLGKSRFAAIRAFAMGIGGGDFRFLGQRTHAAQSGQARRSAVVRLCLDGKTSAGSDLFPTFSAVLGPARIQLTASPAVAPPSGGHTGRIRASVPVSSLGAAVVACHQPRGWPRTQHDIARVGAQRHGSFVTTYRNLSAL